MKGSQGQVAVQRPIDLIESSRWRQALTAGLGKVGENRPIELRFVKRMPPTAKTALRGLVRGDAQAYDVALVEKTAMSLLTDRTGLLS